MKNRAIGLTRGMQTGGDSRIQRLSHLSIRLFRSNPAKRPRHSGLQAARYSCHCGNVSVAADSPLLAAKGLAAMLSGERPWPRGV
ncbi:MAG TPA: hypothetical protein VHC95_04300 [Opitutales bacterium]|nr:hypothetical protein [Opitutales bacterium]